MHIHIEGLDLAGKSTTCQRLLERFPSLKRRNNTLIPNNPIYSLADRIRRTQCEPLSPLALGHMYYSALRYDIELYETPEEPTLQDSTIAMRSLAYHTLRKSPELPEMFENLLDQHPTFELSFVLQASVDVRLKRLEGKHEPAPDDFLVRDNTERFLAMEACLIKHTTERFGSILINTDRFEEGIGMEPIFEAVETLIRQRT